MGKLLRFWGSDPVGVAGREVGRVPAGTAGNWYHGSEAGWPDGWMVERPVVN